MSVLDYLRSLVGPGQTPLRPIPSKPDPMVERFPELAQFFGCYFHQDWDIEAADDEGLVRLYLSQEPESSITAARRELDEFLAEDLNEDELATTLLHSFGCYYSPTFFGFTTRRWLERIRGLLAEGRPPA